MVLTNLKSLILLCLTYWCIDAQPPEKPPDLNRKMVELLNACFADRLNPVVTTPDLHDSFQEITWQTHKPPMILIDKHFVTNGAQHYPRFATFVFAPYSVKSYDAMLFKARTSPWWHEDVSFFIIGNLRDGCRSAKTILERNWRMNLSSTLFLCHEEGEDGMLYTFNPYRNQAPLPWIETGGSRKQNNHWTMYKQKYHEGRKNCASLMFNKLTFMNEKQTDDSSTPNSQDEQTKNRIPTSNNVQNRHSATTSEDFLQSLLSVVDISTILEHDHPCYPHEEKKTRFATGFINESYNGLLKVRNFVCKTISTGLLGQLCSTLSKYSGNVYCISLVLFGIVNMIYKSLESESSLLESSTQLSCGGWIRAREMTVKYFFVGLIQSIFVLSILSQPYLLTHLTKSGVYGANDSKELLTNNLNVVERGMEIDNSGRVGSMSTSCKIILQQTMIAKCKEQFINKNFDEKLSYWCSEHVPLTKKPDLPGMRFGEAEFWDKSYPISGNQYLKHNWIDKIYAQYRPIELEDLTFAFIVLLDGLCLSMMVFIIEISWKLATKIEIYMCKLISCPKVTIRRIP